LNRAPSNRVEAAADIARLVAEHHAWVYRAAYRLCGSVADAEDLTQQTFLTAQRALAQLREPAAARGWLGAILRTGFLKGVRKRRPLSAESHDVDLHDFAAPIADEPAVDGEALQQALGTLSDDSRLILTMFYFEDLSYRDIAEQLEVPIGTVMSRLSRAKEQLRRNLGPNAASNSGDTANDDVTKPGLIDAAPINTAPTNNTATTKTEMTNERDEASRQTARARLSP
jgi:RNA polymerase sigma-70 factor, ECF subfamily